jgi:NAD(P)-dependent dehydrogenase (short-subunit alcohol dehydrogenase family)
MQVKSSKNQYEMQDPTRQYPRPELPDQTQSPPGLAREMDPKPDHGEESYQGFGRLKGRKALITGADSGIGRAAAIAFAREGADIALNYLPSEKPDAKEVIVLIEKAGTKAIPLPGDIQDEPFCKKLVEDARKGLGGLDILVNVAGHQIARDDIADLTAEQFDETFKTNVYAMFWLCKAALPHMPAGATIINTASIVAYQPSKQLLPSRRSSSAKRMSAAATTSTRLRARAGWTPCWLEPITPRSAP